VIIKSSVAIIIFKFVTKKRKKEGEIFMSLDNIQLSYQTCALIFNHNLVQDPAFNSEENSSEKIEIENLGNNRSHALFIINNPNYKFLPDEEMEFLAKLLTACKISMEDIALVHFNYNNYNYRQYNDQFQPQKILIFGMNSAELDLPFDIPHFQVQQFQQQFYLTAPSLSELLNNTTLKRELWSSHQKLFL
jgi:hypothetical protein